MIYYSKKLQSRKPHKSGRKLKKQSKDIRKIKKKSYDTDKDKTEIGNNVIDIVMNDQVRKYIS